MAYYAHSGDNADKSDWQTLEDHLSQVARLAAEYAEPFGAASWAYAAGVLHDAGKADSKFQRRLEGSKTSFDHSTAGGKIALDRYPDSPKAAEGNILAPLILGHHSGLANATKDQRLTSVRRRLAEAEGRDNPPLVVDPPALDEAPMLALQQAAKLSPANPYQALCMHTFLLGHLLYSCLVDADWSDAERVMDAPSYEMRELAISAQLPLKELNRRLDARLAEFDDADSTPVNCARAEMLGRAQAAAALSPGIFTLEMPTGAGKTLSSLSFALRHALAHGKSRVIYAIPFQSIVDQTASQFREILGRESVVEHVSSYDYGYDMASPEDSSENELARRERMLTQNWDAPVIVTTNVQLFESLFSNKPSRSRKVHNIANSVIILDEVQSLPDSLLKPTLAMLESLAAYAGTTIVLCTATQPSLEDVWPFGAKPTDIIPNPQAYDEVFGGRVEFDTSRTSEGDPYTLDELAGELARERQALCVVSSRKAAQAVYEELGERAADKDALFHLSALMVSAHRTRVFKAIRERLAEDEPVLVVSTQLIEAGVDVDFPVVYRETAGVDSVLQAAGRCNREGRMDHPGRVVVFDCADFERPKRANWLSQMHDLGLATLREKADQDPFGLEQVKYFFNRRYQVGGIDGKGVFKHIVGSDGSEMMQRIRGRFDYEGIAQDYRFITDDTVELFVPWSDEGAELLEEIEEGSWSPDLFARIQRFTISLPRYLFIQYENAGAIRMISRFPVPVLETGPGAEKLYDDDRGLLRIGEGEIDALVI